MGPTIQTKHPKIQQPEAQRPEATHSVTQQHFPGYQTNGALPAKAAPDIAVSNGVSGKLSKQIEENKALGRRAMEFLPRLGGQQIGTGVKLKEPPDPRTEFPKDDIRYKGYEEIDWRRSYGHIYVITEKNGEEPVLRRLGTYNGIYELATTGRTQYGPQGRYVTKLEDIRWFIEIMSPRAEQAIAPANEKGA